jgi:hypothetical protein
MRWCRWAVRARKEKVLAHRRHASVPLLLLPKAPRGRSGAVLSPMKLIKPPMKPLTKPCREMSKLEQRVANARWLPSECGTMRWDTMGATAVLSVGRVVGGSAGHSHGQPLRRRQARGEQPPTQVHNVYDREQYGLHVRATGAPMHVAHESKAVPQRVRICLTSV